MAQGDLGGAQLVGHPVQNAPAQTREHRLQVVLPSGITRLTML